MKTFSCSHCHKTKPVQTNGGTGYAKNDKDEFVCYDCCAVLDTAYMKEHNTIALYLTKRDGQNFVTNWPGTLRIGPLNVRKGNHNIAGSRYDVWFSHAGKNWHGVSYGEMTELVRCRALKEAK